MTPNCGKVGGQHGAPPPAIKKTFFSVVVDPTTTADNATKGEPPTNKGPSSTNKPDTITTDEGVVIHQADPTATSNGLGLVWGSVLCPSGIALAKYMVHVANEEREEHHPLFMKTGNSNSNRQSSSPLRILELGCGTGVVGLTCFKYYYPCHVTLTDSETALWPLLRKSIASNKINDGQEDVCIHGLDWRDPTTFLPPQNFDLIVAADVLYSNMDKLFARALASHLLSPYSTTTTRGTYALVASPFRTDSPLSGFLQSTKRLGLACERLEDDQGNAAGAGWGIPATTAYEGTTFVPIVDNNDNNDHQNITTSPTFTASNTKQVQIFRIYRVSGTPEEAASIRRVSRI